MLHLSAPAHDELVAHAYDCLPEEACGLLIGSMEDGSAPIFHRCRNAAASSKLYTIDPRDYMAADRRADEAGLEIIGVVHSHTHTEPYPSPTDVEQAPVPEWHYVIVSLRDIEPTVRSYAIVDGTITEEPVVLDGTVVRDRTGYNPD